jgi:hypothetical protein
MRPTPRATHHLLDVAAGDNFTVVAKHGGANVELADW